MDAILAAPGSRPDPAACRKLLVDAHVVIGVDAASRREFTVYGTPALEQTATVGGQQALRTLRVTLDQTRGQLDQLAALVKVLKGPGAPPGE